MHEPLDCSTACNYVTSHDNTVTSTLYSLLHYCMHELVHCAVSSSSLGSDVLSIFIFPSTDTYTCVSDVTVILLSPNEVARSFTVSVTMTTHDTMTVPRVALTL